MNLENVRSALNYIVEKVYMPTFFAKLAAHYDIKPQNQDDYINLVNLSMSLNKLKNQLLSSAKTKMANAQSIVIQDAVEALSHVTGTAAPASKKDVAIAAGLLNALKDDPELIKSALLISGYMASKQQR